MANSEQPPFVFVVGAGRSGTSLLRTVLDGHSQLAVAHEARFVYPLSRRRLRYEREHGFDVDAFAADLTADTGALANLELDGNDVRAALDGSPIVNYPDAVRRIFVAFARRHGKSRYGDKMPAYVQRIPALSTMFPEARFVHIIRDGRDVALSAMAIADTRRAPDSVDLAIDWQLRVEAGRTAGQQLGHRRYHEVRYEQLVADPAGVVAPICQFLELDFEPEMLRVGDRHEQAPAKLRDNPRHSRLAEPIAAGTRSWRSDLPLADLQRYEAVAGDLLEQLGYARGAPSPPLTARAAAQWGQVRRQAHRARARLPGAARRAVRRAGR